MIVFDAGLVGPWVCERTGGVWSSCDAAALGWVSHGELTAGVIVDHWNGASCVMHVAADAPVTREFTRACFRYVFGQLGAKKALGFVSAKNARALRFDQHLGFVEEHRIKYGHPDGDLVILSMTPAHCRWLDEGVTSGIEKLASACA